MKLRRQVLHTMIWKLRKGSGLPPGVSAGGEIRGSTERRHRKDFYL